MSTYPVPRLAVRTKQLHVKCKAEARTVERMFEYLRSHCDEDQSSLQQRKISDHVVLQGLKIRRDDNSRPALIGGHRVCSQYSGRRAVQGFVVTYMNTY